MYHHGHGSSRREVISILIKEDVSSWISGDNSYIIISEVLKTMYHHGSSRRVVVSSSVKMMYHHESSGSTVKSLLIKDVVSP